MSAKCEERFVLFTLGALHLALCPLHLALCSLRGTTSAEHKSGKHEEVKRAPAAITSLSAACRCASRPPSDPSVEFPPIKSPVRNDRASCFLAAKSEEQRAKWRELLTSPPCLAVLCSSRYAPRSFPFALCALPLALCSWPPLVAQQVLKSKSASTMKLNVPPPPSLL